MMRRQFELVCNECLITQDESHYWAYQAINAGRADGWYVSNYGRKALCPECVAKAEGMSLPPGRPPWVDSEIG